MLTNKLLYMETEEMKILMKLLSEDNFRTYNLFVAQVLGIHEAIFLSHLIAKHIHFDKKGWLQTCKGIPECFFLTVDSIEEYTALSTNMQRKIKSELIKKKVIRIEKAGIPAKNYFKINFDVLYTILKSAKGSVTWNQRNKSSGINGTRAVESTGHYINKNKNEDNNKQVKKSIQANATTSLANQAEPIRTTKTILSAYEKEGTLIIEELASALVIATYEPSGLKALAVTFLDYYVANAEKMPWNANIKSRFNKFVTSDFQGLLKKKSTWPGIDTVTDEQFVELLEGGNFKNSGCSFYQEVVLPTLDTQGRNTFTLMIGYFKNKEVSGWKEYPTFREWAVGTGKIIC